MNETLKAVLSLSLSGALLILLLFLLRPLYKERLSKQWQYYIWLVVVARLLLPFAPETNLMATLFQGIDSVIEQTEIVSPYTQQGGIADIPQTDDMKNGQNNLHSGQTEPAESASNPVRNIVTVVWKNLWLGWLVVALILFIRKITVYQDFVKYIRAGCVEVADIDLLEQFGKLIERNKVKVTVELYTNNLISSPLLIGFFRPSIILPSADLSPVDFEYTILHELTHYKRRDMFYKWLVQFSVCVHWFNPLVYLMSREVSRVCELSCDETVIQALDLQGQRAYGDTLLNAMGAGGNYKNSLASVTLNESKELLKERLDAIMNFRKNSKTIITITFILTLMICCGATYIGAYATPVSTLMSDPEIPFTSNQADTDLYSVYKPFGLTIDAQTGKLFYDGKRVRCFDDQIPGENLSAKGLGYYEKSGVIDIRAVRDNSTGKLLRLEMLSDSEFKDRIINDPMQAVSKTGTDIFDEYKGFGLSYDKSQNALFYNGERVRLFMDIRNSNGKPVDSEDFLGNTTSNLDVNGTIDVYAIRDEKQTDENGDKKLTGLRVATQDEYDTATKSFEQTTRIVESAN